jgi:hypothetical protein
MWLLKKVHTYAGLLTFINLAVYGVVGLSLTALRHPSPVTSRPIIYQDFTVEPNLTDRQVAERVCAQLHLTLATPVNSFAIQHDAANNLFLDLRHVNGGHRITVLEQEHRLRIEVIRNSFLHYLFTLHETTAAFHSGDWRMQFWADYNEFAMWCLLLMLASGFAMFLATRARTRLAQMSLAAGCFVFAALYYWTK